MISKLCISHFICINYFRSTIPVKIFLSFKTLIQVRFARSKTKHLICYAHYSSSILSTLVLQDLYLIWAALMSSQEEKHLLSADWCHIYVYVYKKLWILYIGTTYEKWLSGIYFFVNIHKPLLVLKKIYSFSSYFLSI